MVRLVIAFVIRKQILLLVAPNSKSKTNLYWDRSKLLLCVLGTRKPDLVGESSHLENLLTGYWRSERCMCLYCILQVHHRHVAFWVNVWMATLYRWKQSRRHCWSPSYITARRFGCHQPSTDCLQVFLDWVGMLRLMWKSAVLPAALSEGSRQRHSFYREK